MRQEQYSLLLPVRICFRKSLLIFSERNDILRTRKAPTPKWMPPENWLDVLTDTAYPVGRQDRHFYFFLFLLSRKARNVTTKLPKDISNANIPMKIEMIS